MSSTAKGNKQAATILDSATEDEIPKTQEEFNAAINRVFNAVKEKLPDFHKSYMDNLYKEYLDSFPADRGIVIFTPEALAEMKNHFHRLGEKYGIKDPEQLSYKIINEALTKFTASL